MGTTLKAAVQKAKVNDVVKQIAAITTYEAVAKELNEDGTVKTSLKSDLETFLTSLAQKANSATVTEEIQEACNELYNKIVGNVGNGTINEAYDTLKEIADWIGTHGTAAAAISSEIAELKSKVTTLTQEIGGKTSTTVEASETNGNIKVDGTEVPVYRNPGKNIFVASTAAEATAAEAKMQNGDLLFQIV